MRLATTAAAAAARVFLRRQPPVRAASSSSSTIYAVATGAGPSGVAVVRVSGPAAAGALRALTPGAATLPSPREMALRTLVDPATGRTVDRGMVVWFPAPRSFTGEEVAELHVHGGRATVQGVMAALAAVPPPPSSSSSSVGTGTATTGPTPPALRLAERGEFTRRAFENGKLDLLQVEAIADLVAADTEAQLQQALRQAGGEVGRRYDAWRGQMLGMLAQVEACIDFGDDEEDVDATTLATTVASAAAALRGEIVRVLEDRRGEAIRDGVRVAIVGPPNAGKSSLLNVLAGRDAAIVSDVPGTTRDVVEVRVNMGGVPVLLSDTAGIRESAGASSPSAAASAAPDAVERIGIAKARALARDADILLCMFDATAAARGGEDDGGDDDDGGVAAALREVETLVAARGADHHGSKDVLVALNKVDLLGDTDDEVDRVPAWWRTATTAAAPAAAGGLPALAALTAAGGVHGTSCAPHLCPGADDGLHEDGIGRLYAALEEQVVSRFGCEDGGGVSEQSSAETLQAEGAFVTRARHRVHLVECEEALGRALGHLATGSVELAAEDLRIAGAAVGRIGGRIDPEEVLDKIFLEFCIGK